MVAAALPSISPKEGADTQPSVALHPPPATASNPDTARLRNRSLDLRGNIDVQTTFRSLRAHARADHALPKGSAGLGRTHWIRPRAGQELALDGVRLPHAVGGSCWRTCLAVERKDRSRPGWSKSIVSARPKGSRRPTSTINPPTRRSPTIWRALSRTSEACRPTVSFCARIGFGHMILRPIVARPRSTTIARNNDPFAKLGKAQISVDVSSVIRASSESFRVAWTQRIYETAR